MCFNAYKHDSTHAVCMNTCALYCFLRISIICVVIEMVFLLCLDKGIKKKTSFL